MQQLLLDRRYWLIPLAGWTLIVSISLFLNLKESALHSKEMVKERAHFILEVVSSMHLWNARQGGIYAQSGSPHNPHFEKKDSDIITPSGRKSLVNPARMTRQLSEILHKQNDILIRLTSLKPIDPDNAALPWESDALQRFEQNHQLKEWSAFSGQGEKREFRYITPLVTESSCMKCHEEQGYKVGDIRGAISITFPSGPLLVSSMEQEHNFVLAHLSVWLLLNLLTMFGLTKYRKQLLQLQALMAHQEKLVEERTSQLQHEVFDREAAEERLRLFIEASAEGIIVIDNKLRCTLCNPAALGLLGYQDESQVLGLSIHKFLCPHRGKPLSKSANGCDECPIRQTLACATPFHDEEISFMHANGHSFHVDMHCSPIEIEGLTLGSVITFSDITERKEQEAITWSLANTDTLTGLINRNQFLSRLEQTLLEAERYGRRFALLFIDLDGFKAVNDNHGHDAGDSLLRIVAQRLQTSVRESDTVARLGGDEFTIIMPDIQAFKEVEVVAKNVIDILAKPYTIRPKQVLVSASIGIAAYPTHANDSRNLLIYADAAMYLAKSAGKNTFRWHQQPQNREETAV